MNEEFLQHIHSTLYKDKVDFETFRNDFEGNDEFIEHTFNQLGYSEKGITLDRFRSDLGIGENQSDQGVITSATPIGPTSQSEEAQKKAQKDEKNLNKLGVTTEEVLNGTAVVSPSGFSSSKTMLDDFLGDTEEEIKEIEGGFLTNLGRALKSKVSGFFTGDPTGFINQTVSKSRKEEQLKNKREELNSAIDVLPQDVGTIDYESTYNAEVEKAEDETFEGASSQELITRTNNAMRQHKNRLASIRDRRFEKLNDDEKQMAEIIMGGNVVDSSRSSDAFKSWESAYLDYGKQVSNNRSTLDKYTELTKGAITEIAKAGDTEGTDPRQKLISYFDSIIEGDDPEQAALAKEYKDRFLKSDSQFGFIGEQTVLGGALNQTLLKGANSIAGLFDTIGNLFREDDKGFSDKERKLIDELSLAKDIDEVQKALANNPGTQYSGALSENVVDIGNVRLAVENGKVVEVRNLDGTKVFDLDSSHKNAIRKYENSPDEYKPRKDYRGEAILAQGTQVLSDMGLIMTTGPVSGSVLAMYGDLYDEALEETGSVAQAAAFAGGTSLLIGLSEKLPIALEGKLNRALTQTEKSAIKSLPGQVTREASERASKEILAGANWVTRAKRSARALLKDVPEDIIGEAFQEVVIENGIQSAMAGITGVDDQPLTFKDVEDTAILTVLASLGPSSMKTLSKGGYLEKALSFAAKDLDAFDTVAQNYVDNATNETDKVERLNKVSDKREIIKEINSTDVFLEDIGVTAPKQRKNIKDLTIQKVNLIVEKQNSKSDVTKEIIDEKLVQLDKDLKDEKVRLYNLDNSEKIALNENGEIATPKEIAKQENNTAVATTEPNRSTGVTPKGQDNSLPTTKDATSIENEEGSSDPSSNLSQTNQINVEPKQQTSENQSTTQEIPNRDETTQEPVLEENATIETPSSVKFEGSDFVKNADNVWVRVDKKGNPTKVKTDFKQPTPNKTVSKAYKEALKNDRIDQTADRQPVQQHLDKIARENGLKNPTGLAASIEADGSFTARDVYTDKDGNSYEVLLDGTTSNGLITEVKSQNVQLFERDQILIQEEFNNQKTQQDAIRKESEEIQDAKTRGESKSSQKADEKKTLKKQSKPKKKAKKSSRQANQKFTELTSDPDAMLKYIRDKKLGARKCK